MQVSFASSFVDLMHAVVGLEDVDNDDAHEVCQCCGNIGVSMLWKYSAMLRKCFAILVCFFCNTAGLLCRIVGLFYKIVVTMSMRCVNILGPLCHLGFVCNTVGLFCRIVGLFSNFVGLFCQ